MSMKKSEYRRQRIVAWRSSANLLDETIQVLVNRDVDAVESAGYAWEPEEPELPTEICWRLVAGLATVRGLPKHGPSVPLTPVAATEVVRRYNVLPKIEHAFRRWQKAEYGDTSADCTFSTELHALFMDDKEGA